MNRLFLLLLAGFVVEASLGAVAAQQAPGTGTGVCVMQRVTDGDTVACADGRRIRLLLIDAPEMDQEPFGSLARDALADLLPVGTPARVELDVQQQDRYRRTLAYLYTPDGHLANVEMARLGYVLLLTYPPNVRYVDEVRGAVEEARAARRGLWAVSAFECSPVDYRAGRCGQQQQQSPPSRQQQNCHASYPDFCIPPPPPDLDCADITGRKPLRVVGADPHRLDGDDDGLACEG